MLSHAWAKNININSLEYQSGVLNVHSAGRIHRPQVEVWPSNSGKETTQVVILSFADVEADIPTLQRTVNQMLLENSELKRFLITPLSDSQKEPTGFQMVIEVLSTATLAESPPAIATLNDQQLQIILKPGSSSSNAVPTKTTSHSQAETLEPTEKIDLRPIQNASAIKPPNIILPYHPNSNQAPQNYQPQKPEPFQNTRTESPLSTVESQPQASEDQPISIGGTTETIPTSIQLAQLKRELQASQAREEALRMELTQYDDRIRGYLPEGAKTSGDTTLRNLRVALVKVATKLKATEKALDAQTAKTRELASQLAEVKRDPSILADPLLMIEVAETVNDQDTDTAGSTQQTRQGGPPKEVLEKIQFKPAPDRAAMLEQAKARELEITLKTAIRENPENTDAYLKLANFYLERLNLTSAESVLTRMVAHHPTNSSGYYQLAWVYVREKRPLEAQATLDTYKRMKPQDTKGIRLLQDAIRNESGV